jgi:two-component system, OmpR family, sensor histidine kinase KdpD
VPTGDEDRDLADDRAELVAKLAHEVRGPVSTIRGIATTALAHYEALSEEERREFFGLIRHEAERMERTVEQIALALRLDADAVRPHRRPHDLIEVVRAAAAAGAGDRPVTIDAPGELVAPIDVTLVSRLARELIDNAVRFSPDGSPIAIRVAGDDSQVSIDIRDAGPGIPADRRDDVFGRFTEWRPTGYEDRAGPGLGLFISRAVARLHGGETSIVDHPEGGTMLSVRLPRGADA